VVEYGLIIACPIWVGYSVAGSPYCEGELHRADEKKMKQKFKLIEDVAQFVQQAEAERDALEHLLKRMRSEDHHFAQLTVWICGEGEDGFASVENVVVKWEDGKRKTDETMILQYLRISWKAAQAFVEKSAEIEKHEAEAKAQARAEKAKAAAEEAAKKVDDGTAQPH
jgi:hypothetical protein